MNSYLARSLCVGAMEHIIIRWLLKDRKYSLLQYADELADLLIDSLRRTDSKIPKTMGLARMRKSVLTELYFYGGINADT